MHISLHSIMFFPLNHAPNNDSHATRLARAALDAENRDPLR